MEQIEKHGTLPREIKFKVVSERAQKGVTERKDRQKTPGDKKEDMKTTRKLHF